MVYTSKHKFKDMPSVEDYKLFPFVEINNSEPIFNFKKNSNSNFLRIIEYKDQGVRKSADLNEFLISTTTTAFIVIKNDEVLYENYFNAHNRDLIHRTFSITKSFTSALIGIAIDEGYIKSIYEPVTEYIPELRKNGFDRFTIQNLLRMDSGIKFKEGKYIWDDEPKTYFSTNCRKLCLNLKISDEIDKFFHYNDYHSLLLGIILERTIKKSVVSYFEEKIWKSIGMEFPATISIDNKRYNFPKWESGLNARAIDLAKFGRLYLNYGNWNGRQILPKSWIRESTDMHDATTAFERFRYYESRPWGKWFKSEKGYYKYLWWGYKMDENTYDYFAMGILGQFIYISPRKNAIVIRLGKKWGAKDWWPTILKELVDKL
jgi:CubicO group peptidase (beta-lactamase class C family)